MNFIQRHWQGDLSVATATWLSGFLAWLVTAPVGYLEWRAFLAANNASGISDLIDHAQDGALSSSAGPPLLQGCDVLLSAIAFVWWGVGTWRACDNSSNRRKTGKSHWFLKLTIMLMAAGVLYDFYDFATKLSGA